MKRVDVRLVPYESPHPPLRLSVIVKPRKRSKEAKCSLYTFFAPIYAGVPLLHDHASSGQDVRGYSKKGKLNPSLYNLPNPLP